MHVSTFDNFDQSYETIQFVLTNIGGSGEKAAHPIHLHDHSFQVAGTTVDLSTMENTIPVTNWSHVRR